MKVLNVQQIPNLVKAITIATPLMLTPIAKAQNFEQKADVFEKSNITCVENTKIPCIEVKPIVIGTNDIYPALVFDKSKGNMYHYDLECYLYDVHNLSANNNLSQLKPGLKRIKSIDKESDIEKQELNTNSNKITLENISMKNGRVIGSDTIYFSEENELNNYNNKLKNNIKLPKESLEFLLDNLYKEQYILIK